MGNPNTIPHTIHGRKIKQSSRLPDAKKLARGDRFGAKRLNHLGATTPLHRNSAQRNPVGTETGGKRGSEKHTEEGKRRHVGARGDWDRQSALAGRRSV